MKRDIRTWLCSLIAAGALISSANAFAQSEKTTTASNSVGAGKTNARFVWTADTRGPSSIMIGDLGRCAIPDGPYPNDVCKSEGGKGALDDPFRFKCSAPLALTGCTAGTEFKVVAGNVNSNTHTHEQRVAGPQIAARVE